MLIVSRASINHTVRLRTNLDRTEQEQEQEPEQEQNKHRTNLIFTTNRSFKSTVNCNVYMNNE